MNNIFKSFVCTLAIATSIPGFAREGTEARGDAASDAKLSTLDAAKLKVRLDWAKLYLADLEKNDKVMSALGVPVQTSVGRTAYAVGVTAVNGGLIATTYALAQKALATEAAGKAVMNSDRVKYFVIQNGKNSTQLKVLQGQAKLGTLPVGKTYAELATPYVRAIEHNNKSIQGLRAANKYTTMHRAVRSVGLTLGVGLVATLIYDGVRTWFQVQHNGEQVEQQKQDLRDFIAYAEDRLAR